MPKERENMVIVMKLSAVPTEGERITINHYEMHVVYVLRECVRSVMCVWQRHVFIILGT